METYGRMGCYPGKLVDVCLIPDLSVYEHIEPVELKQFKAYIQRILFEMIKILLLLTSVLVAMPVAAVDVAPRISDREIIESLAELKAGQKLWKKRWICVSMLCRNR